MTNVSKVYLDDCIEMAGNDRLGRFLYRLWKWQFHTNIVRDDRRWVAWTYAQWADALKISYTQFKYMIEKPRARELLVREQHQRHGKNVLFIRFTDECLVDLLLPKSEKGKSAQLGDGQKCPTLYKNPKKEPGESTKIANGSAVAAPDSVSLGKNSEEQNIGNVIKFASQADINAAEIAKKFAEAKPKSVDTLKPDKVASMIVVWHQQFKERKLVAPTVTGQMRGQFRHLMKAWSDDAPTILAFSMRRWDDLTYAAEKHHGAFKSPDVPNVGYLLKFQNVAVDLWKKAKAGPKIQKQPVDVHDFVQSIAQTPEQKNAEYLKKLLAS